MSHYEAQRLENLRQKEQLLAQLNLDSTIIVKKSPAHPATRPPSKKRKLNSTPFSSSSQPTRTSSRLASSSASKPSYHDSSPEPATKASKSRRIKNTTSTSASASHQPPDVAPTLEVASLRASWTSWQPTEPPPTRDPITFTFHFPSHPEFTPNKSPQEILHEGSFGGSYWRPLYSQTLRTTVADDWRELPAEWLVGLDVSQYLTRAAYAAEANKYGVACGQSIEEWEAAGWINHTHDVRGWFQWYCRFFQGRRCDDDERQVGRWMRCVGPKGGRWKRMLLKKYLAMGVREVFDDGGEEEERQVSPVMHQTCHHWAFEVRQEVLDEFWRTGK